MEKGDSFRLKYQEDIGVKVDLNIRVHWDDGDGMAMKGKRMIGPVSSDEMCGKVTQGLVAKGPG